MDVRPAKRARQACDRCRRKKTRCPGEKPICSFCAKLSQSCTYSDPTSLPPREQEPANDTNGASGAEHVRSLERRFEGLERKIDQMHGELQSALMLRRTEVCHTGTPEGQIRSDQGSRTPPDQRNADPVSVPEVTLPRPSSYEKGQHILPRPLRLDIVKLYIQRCDCQPISLFDLNRLKNQFESYCLPIQYLVLATGVRFCNDPLVQGEQELLAAEYSKTARHILFELISDGEISITKLQSICLSVVLDLSSGNFDRARLHCDLGISLCRSSKLSIESETLPQDELEERRKCFWAFYHLGCLTSPDPNPLFSKSYEQMLFPPSLSVDLQYCVSVTPSFSNYLRTMDMYGDLGVVGYSLQLFELWQTSLNYIINASYPSEPAWTPNSTQFQLVQRIMEWESILCKYHRNAHVRFADRSAADVELNAGYWRPWLGIQFTYHATLCLLHHPFVFSEEIIKGETTPSKVAFLEQAWDLALYHAKRLVRLITTLEQKGVPISDPFQGYCIAIAASVLLWFCYVEDHGVKMQARARLSTCFKFIVRLAKHWPIARRLANNLATANMRASVWTRVTMSDVLTYDIPNQDVQLIWRLLRYSDDVDPSPDDLQLNLPSPPLTVETTSTQSGETPQEHTTPEMVAGGSSGGGRHYDLQQTEIHVTDSNILEAAYLLYDQASMPFKGFGVMVEDFEP